MTALRASRTGQTEWLAGGVQNRTDVLLIISERKAAAAPSPSQLTDMFGLTPTEARLACQLACGMLIGAYGNTFCVSVATARPHAVAGSAAQNRAKPPARSAAPAGLGAEQPQRRRAGGAGPLPYQLFVLDSA